MTTHRRLHRLAVPLILLASIAIVGLAPQRTPGPGEQRQHPVHGWRIEPGKIEPIFGGPNGALSGISGSFKLVKDPNGSTSKRGGACLVFQPTDEPKACQSDSDCPKFDFADGYGYCISGPGRGTGSSCWAKKDESYCLKSPTQDLEEGKIYTFPTSGTGVAAFPLGPSRKLAWRVVTCQNLVPFGCAGGEPGSARIEYGHVWKKNP